MHPLPFSVAPRNFFPIFVKSHLTVYMSSTSNKQGRGYEYACIVALTESIRQRRQVNVERNGSYEAAKEAFDSLTSECQDCYIVSAKAAAGQILELEPNLVVDVEKPLALRLQADKKGVEGDIRDIVISDEQTRWEIGLSVKHNHFAVKHSRLSPNIDFAKQWFGRECSRAYWEDVAPVFDFLKAKKDKKIKFADIEGKESRVYVPLLNAFVAEMKRQYEQCPDITKRLVEYLLGRFDFYKVISIDRQHVTRLQGFNLHDTLNRSANGVRSKIEVPLVPLPSRIIAIGLAPGSNTTVELFLDRGWQFSFRIHNAETYATPSLKFDVQIVGLPTAFISINCYW